MSDRHDVKRRIEAEYELETQSVETGSEHLGQMTIAFCAMGDDVTDWCKSNPDCYITD